jgi:hypothetical protein
VGAWGTGPFENDGALDWVWLLGDATDLEPQRLEDRLTTHR